MSAWVSAGFLQSQSDARLLALSRGGHKRAFEALVHRYRKPLLAHCRRMRVPDAKAEDAVQQGLLQAWVALQDGAEVRDARPWLYRIVHNAALRMLAPSGHDEAQLSESLVAPETLDSELDLRITMRETLAGVAALPALQREALIRTAVNGDSHEHVAAVLGLSDGAVRGLVYRARTALRKAATAWIPFPLVDWGTHAGRKANQLSQRLAELGAGGGGLAGAGAFVKGGAAVTAGVLVVGAAVLHPPRAASAHRPHGPVPGLSVSVKLTAAGGRPSSVAGGGGLGIPRAGAVAASLSSAIGSYGGSSLGSSSPGQGSVATGSSSPGQGGLVTSSSGGGGGRGASSSASSGAPPGSSGGGGDSAASSGASSGAPPGSAGGGDSGASPGASSGGGGTGTTSSSSGGGDTGTTSSSSGGGDTGTTSSSSGVDTAASATPTTDNPDTSGAAPPEPAGSTPGGSASSPELP